MPDGYPFIQSPANPVMQMLAAMAAQGNAAKLNAYEPLGLALAGAGRSIGQGMERKTGYEQDAARLKAQQEFAAKQAEDERTFGELSRKLAAEDAFVRAKELEQMRQQGRMRESSPGLLDYLKAGGAAVKAVGQGIGAIQDRGMKAMEQARNERYKRDALRQQQEQFDVREMRLRGAQAAMAIRMANTLEDKQAAAVTGQLAAQTMDARRNLDALQRQAERAMFEEVPPELAKQIAAAQTAYDQTRSRWLAASDALIAKYGMTPEMQSARDGDNLSDELLGSIAGGG